MPSHRYKECLGVRAIVLIACWATVDLMRKRSGRVCAPATSRACSQGATPNMAVDWADCGGSWNVPSHYGEAEKLERQTLEIQRRILGPDHPHTAISTYNLGGTALHKRKSPEPLSLFPQALYPPPAP